jgi:hypothetical protein
LFFIALLIIIQAADAVNGKGGRKDKDNNSTSGLSDADRNEAGASACNIRQYPQTARHQQDEIQEEDSSVDADLEKWIEDQVLQALNPHIDPEIEKEDEISAIQARITQSVLSTLASDDVDLVRAILMDPIALSAMRNARNILPPLSNASGIASAANRTDTGERNYAKAAQAKKPSAAHVYNNMAVRTREYRNIDIDSILKIAMNLFKTSVTAVNNTSWHMPMNKPVETGCLAALGCYFLQPFLRGPGNLVSTHPLCPYTWEEIRSAPIGQRQEEVIMAKQFHAHRSSSCSS